MASVKKALCKLARVAAALHATIIIAWIIHDALYEPDGDSTMLSGTPKGKSGGGHSLPSSHADSIYSATNSWPPANT